VLFGDIESVHVIFDDMIIAARNDEEHDRILHKVLTRARECGLQFNSKKIQFRVSQVKYGILLILKR